MASAHETYLESRILTADPIELVRILYRLAMDRIREARQHLDSGDVAARGRAISSASQVLAELARSLDFETGAEISARLAQLYQYMQLKLLEASYHQSAEPLNEVLGLLNTLAEAWQAVKPDAQPAPPLSMPPWPEDPAAEETCPAGWSA